MLEVLPVPPGHDLWSTGCSIGPTLTDGSGPLWSIGVAARLPVATAWSPLGCSTGSCTAWRLEATLGGGRVTVRLPIYDINSKHREVGENTSTKDPPLHCDTVKTNLLLLLFHLSSLTSDASETGV